MPPGHERRPMHITFTKTSMPWRYTVSVNGRQGGTVVKEDSTGVTWWIYECGKEEGEPILHGAATTREWAVREAIIAILCQASDVQEWFAL